MNSVRAISKALGFSLPVPGVASAHFGSVIGSVGAGLGNSKKNVSPAIFAGAMRYHTGGVVGLRPNEVPIIAKKNEEMINESDPRHRNNGGLAEKGGGGAQAIRNIITLDPDFAASMMKSPSG